MAVAPHAVPIVWPRVVFMPPPDTKALCLAMVNIGHALVLRSLLKGALGESVNEVMPALGMVADDTQQQSASSTGMWRAARLLAADAGRSTAERDESLNEAFGRLMGECACVWLGGWLAG